MLRTVRLVFHFNTTHFGRGVLRNVPRLNRDGRLCVYYSLRLTCESIFVRVSVTEPSLSWSPKETSPAQTSSVGITQRSCYCRLGAPKAFADILPAERIDAHIVGRRRTAAEYQNVSGDSVQYDVEPAARCDGRASQTEPP